MDILETNTHVVAQFRAGGPVEGMHREGLLLLTTTGRRTGEPRTSPMMFVRDNGRLLVIASNLGAPGDPQWCLNLRADPRATIEVGDEAGSPARPVVAAVVEGADRERLWARLVGDYPFFAEHAVAAAPREIPVVELTPA